MEDLGVPNYNELIFVTRRDFLNQDGASKVRRFLQATARGHELLRTDPDAGVDALLAHAREQRKQLDLVDGRRHRRPGRGLARRSLTRGAPQAALARRVGCCRWRCRRGRDRCHARDTSAATIADPDWDFAA